MSSLFKLDVDGYLLGCELEDCELPKRDGVEFHQAFIRPISNRSYRELWEHGKKHCSKYVIYICIRNVVWELRPDKLNYDTDGAMYNTSIFDIIKASQDYLDEVKKNYIVKMVKKQRDDLMDLVMRNAVKIEEIHDNMFNITYKVH